MLCLRSGEKALSGPCSVCVMPAVRDRNHSLVSSTSQKQWHCKMRRSKASRR